MFSSLMWRMAPSRALLSTLLAPHAVTTAAAIVPTSRGLISRDASEENQGSSQFGEGGAITVSQRLPQPSRLYRHSLQPSPFLADVDVPMSSHITKSKEAHFPSGVAHEQDDKSNSKFHSSSAVSSNVLQTVEDPRVHIWRDEEKLLRVSVERLQAERELAEMRRGCEDELLALREGLKAREGQVERIVRRAKKESAARPFSLASATTTMTHAISGTGDWAVADFDKDAVDRLCDRYDAESDVFTLNEMSAEELKPKTRQRTCTSLQDSDDSGGDSVDAGDEDDFEMLVTAPVRRRGRRKAASTEVVSRPAKRGRKPSVATKESKGKGVKKRTPPASCNTTPRSGRKSGTGRASTSARRSAESGRGAVARVPRSKGPAKHQQHRKQREDKAASGRGRGRPRKTPAEKHQSPSSSKRRGANKAAEVVAMENPENAVARPRRGRPPKALMVTPAPQQWDLFAEID
ncbi:unnamed protein product [Trypanosoma congolense IL3000]|uniref:WGS project CAEQ00000000 data, annotated contig 68 n=1 Tax=Trypanosoma congolense (strain IL3000) TaxID=1068625 RepID=F9WHQ4_TRYCI|nr:unnamed protein product [Trypanosoma congolense IL3000]